MKDESSKYSHSDLEFVVREEGLEVTADLLSVISELSDALEGSYASTEEALQAVSTFATKAINQVPLSLSVIEARLRAVERALDADGSAK